MGYTHYWTQLRSFKKDEWEQVSTDIGAILKDVQHVQNIPLSNWDHDSNRQPEFTESHISFNGVGEDGHESFMIGRRMPSKDNSFQFCKTAEKPYDLAVMAVLCYLATVPDPVALTVSSDGKGHEWQPGLAEAKLALPQYGNILDIPKGIMEDDRWIGPWMHSYTDKYRFTFCVDGYAYILKFTRGKLVDSFRFDSHAAAAVFFNQNKAVLDATGYFDEVRRRHLKRDQDALLGRFFRAAGLAHARGHMPPAFVRPGEFLQYETGPRWVNVEELIAGAKQSA